MAKKKAKQQSNSSNQLTYRVMIIFMVITVLFVILVGRLFYMQVIHKSFYTAKIKSTTTTTITSENVRGSIYDANGKLLAGNTEYTGVAFTRSNTMTADYMLKLAQKIATLTTPETVKVTTRDKKDYYLADSNHYSQIVQKLSKKEKYDAIGNSLSSSKIYANAIKHVTQKDIAYSDSELKVVGLFKQMNGISNFNTVMLNTEPLTDSQIAAIKADKKELDGISIKDNWERNDADQSLASIIGTVSSKETGLPSGEVKTYLKKGYSLNDRVGTSYLEKEYESVLQGKHTVKTVTLNKDGSIKKKKTVSKGSNGKNLKLTIDSNFQSGVQSILEKYFKSELSNGGTKYSEGAYAVVLNVNTGAVLAMAGLSHESESSTYTPDALGNITGVFTPGSVVKPATLTSGWQNNVLSGNETIDDQPIYVQGSNVIESWFTSGKTPLTAAQALEYSSNTYMVQLAIRMLGQNYSYDMTLDDSKLKSSMSELRKTYAQYGLGTSTGIDLPGESTGYLPKKYTAGNFLTEAFGQYDNYTPMQLAQYAATIANGGTRLAPHLVEGIYSSDKTNELGKEEKATKTKTLNKVDISSSDMQTIHDGMYNVVYGSSYRTGRYIGFGASVPISAKTGTAEAYITNSAGQSVYTTNDNVIAYAPSNSPKIAVAVVLPHETNIETTIPQTMTREIVNLYNSLHPLS